MALQDLLVLNVIDISSSSQPPKESTQGSQEWTKGTCPNCGYTKADVDTYGVLWCPACGYSRKGCYT